MKTILENMHPEALEWIEDFRKNDLTRTGPDAGTHIANGLSMMQVVAPGTVPNDARVGGVLTWCYIHQQLYNSVIWYYLIQSGKLLDVRAAFEKDLLYSQKIPGDRRVFGQIVSHEYGKAVLKNFRREILKLE
jgi:hypothetical protein